MAALRLRSRRALLLLAAMVGAPSCKVPRLPHCPDICAQLLQCKYLPSVLGVSEEALGDGAPGSAEASCVSRCDLSSDDGPYQQIRSCWAEQSGSGDVCDPLGQCLHARFPDTPITGVSDLRLEGRAPRAGAADAGALPTSCPFDAGGLAILSRGFVEVWGKRRYSDSRTCDAGFVAELDGVDAAERAVVGFEIRSGGSCREYRASTTIPAGWFDLQIDVDLAGEEFACGADQTNDAGTGDRLPGDPDGG